MQNLFEYTDGLNHPMEAFHHVLCPGNFPILPHWHYFIEIIYMLDLKMDVGYHRDNTAGEDKQSYVAKAKSLLENLALLKDAPEISTKSGNKKKSKTDSSAPRYYFSMHPQASYDEVIISSKNAGNKEKEQQLIGRAKDPSCNIWVLSIGEHPNEYRNDVNMCPLYENWGTLLQKIRSILE